MVSRAIDEARAALERTAANAAGDVAVDVVLYVTESPASLRALRNLERFVRARENLRLRLRVWDLSREPLGPDAAEDRVAFTPMLVKREPPPRERLLGDLSHEERLEELLFHEPDTSP